MLIFRNKYNNTTKKKQIIDNEANFYRYYRYNENFDFDPHHYHFRCQLDNLRSFLERKLSIIMN